MRKVLIAVSLVWAVAVWAQNQVATVTSSAPFILRGAAVTPGQGVPTWPILAGDNLKGGNAPTIVTFPDGSVLTLDPVSEAKIDVANGKPVFQLLSGTARYSLKSTSAVQLMAANRRVTPKGITGTLSSSTQAGGAAAGGAAAGGAAAGGAAAGGAAAGGAAAGGAAAGVGLSTAVIVGVSAAAAAGLGIGISQATGGGTPVSPSAP